jgi:hypothetical protein
LVTSYSKMRVVSSRPLGPTLRDNQFQLIRYCRAFCGWDPIYEIPFRPLASLFPADRQVSLVIA